jgi:hypothetical protein
VLMPAAMALLGDRNWYLPRWLAWLPGGQGRHSIKAPDLYGPGLPGLDRDAAHSGSRSS